MEESPFKILETKPLPKTTKALLVITYFLYITIWQIICIGGAAYVTFVLGRSAWWMILGCVMASSTIKTHNWYSLWDGVERKDKEDEEDKE